MYTPTSAKFVFGSAGFSARLTTTPSASSATPKFSGSSTGVNKISASGALASNALTSSRMPPCSRLSPRYITNELSPRNGSAVSTACANPAGSSCVMYVIATPNCEPSPATCGSPRRSPAR